MTTKYDITQAEYYKIQQLRNSDVPFRQIKTQLFSRYRDMPTPTLRKRYYKWLDRQSAPAPVWNNPPPGSHIKGQWAFTDTGDNEAVVTFSTMRDPRLGMVITTLEELIEVADIDLDIWRVVRWKPNAWGQNSVATGYTTLYQVTAWLERIIPLNTAAAISDALAEVRSAAPVYLYKAYEYTEKKEKIMMEVNLSDLHVGKRGWIVETGTEYNIQIARQRLQDACSQLLSHTNGYHIEHIVLAMCGDMINADGPDGKTTRGTQQDMAGQYLEIFRAARAMMVEAIMLFRAIAPVKVVIVCGNHDKYTSYLLADILEAMFFNDERVAIDNEPFTRKYHKYGKNLIGFAHRPDFKKLPGLMASEQPRLWADTTHREWHAGHFHIERVEVDTIFDVTVRTVPALTAPDEWTVGAGYRSKAGAQSFLWHKEKNLVGTFYAKV